MTKKITRRQVLQTAALASIGGSWLASSTALFGTTTMAQANEKEATRSGKKEILCCFGVDVDAVAGWIGTYGGKESVRDISRGMFAGEVGIPRLLKLFERWGVKQTFFAPGHSIETFPEQMKQVADAGHEIGAHGYTHENPAKMSREQEVAVLDKSIDLITRLTGNPPVGYVAPFWEFSKNTLELLIKRGFKYDHSMMQHDFIPYYLRDNLSWTNIDYSQQASQWMKPTTQGPRTNLIEIPASWYMDDLPPMMFMDHIETGMGYTSPHSIEQMWKDRFDWMYREYDYAVYTITIHPRVAGHAQNILMLERLYKHIIAHDGVKFVPFKSMASDFAKRSRNT